MKKLLITISVAAFQLCQAQVTMVGMSQRGGFSSHGTIFTVNSSSGNIETLYNFNEGLNGCVPHGGLVQDSDGSFYGVASGCGIHNVGTLVKYNGVNHGITKLIDFHSNIGANPVGDLVIGSDGNLYGMTNSGGINDFGTIFKCTTNGQLTTLASFNRGNGAYPKGSLVKDCCGNLYGMTRLGGDFDKGVIFKCTSSGIVTVLHSFNGDDGSMPEGNLIIVKDSLLYGVSQNGGTGGAGSIFLCSVSGKFAVLNNFNTYTGTQPSGSLLNGGDGYLYGATNNGGAYSFGTLFRCTEAGKITVLFNFNDTNGASPQGTLAKASDGIIYGITIKGCSSDAGGIFKYNVSTGVLENITEFTSANTQMASGGLVEMKLNTDMKAMASSKKFNKHNSSSKKASHSGTGEL